MLAPSPLPSTTLPSIRAGAQQKKTPLPSSSTSPLQLVCTGAVLGALITVFLLVNFTSPSIKHKSHDVTFVTSGLRSSLRHNPADEFLVGSEATAASTVIKETLIEQETLIQQMKKINDSLEKKLSKEYKERLEVVSELQIAAVEEDKLKERVAELEKEVSSSTTTTTSSQNIQNIQIGADQSLESMLAAHKQLQADMISGKKPMRAITFGAKGTSDVGGFGNRMIGMLSGMLLALYHNRAYYIEHKTGFNMNDYYDGSNHNIPWSHLLSDAPSQVSVVDFQGAQGRVRCVTMFQQLEKIAKTTINIGFRTNQDCFLDIHMHYEKLKPGLLARRDTLTVLYNYLFKPTAMFAPIVQALTNHVRTPEEIETVQTVCTHIRTGKIQGGSDPSRQGKTGGFPNFVKNKIVKCTKIVAKNTAGMLTMPIKTRYFIAADNDQALQIFKSAMGSAEEVIDGSSVPGLANIIHVARSGSKVNSEGVMRMLADFEVFRRSCDYIILAPSTFSNLAYFVSSFFLCCCCCCCCCCLALLLLLLLLLLFGVVVVVVVVVVVIWRSFKFFHPALLEMVDDLLT